MTPITLLPLANRRQHLGAAQQPERRLGLGGTREQFEEIPLWDQGDVFVPTGQPSEVDTDLSALNIHPERLDLPVRQLGEPVAEAELVEQPQRAGMNGVTAKVAKEIGVLLHDGDVHARAGEQQAQHHACRAAAGDDAACSLAVAGHPAIFAP